MKIHLLSDLHFEFQRGPSWKPNPLDADVVILAGDISSHTYGLDWAAWAFKEWPSQPKLLYVAGNHEYYGAHLGMLSEFQKPSWESAGVTFLEKRAVEINGVRFLGCTLWSDFSLYGLDRQAAYMEAAQRGIADYDVIYGRERKTITPHDTLELHKKAVSWLDRELARPFNGKTVVITHFAPHLRCVATEYEGSELSPYFVTDLSWLMTKHRIDVWCYGHTHTNTDFIAQNGCRVISNQKGYPRELIAGNQAFDATLTVEI